MRTKRKRILEEIQRGSISHQINHVEASQTNDEDPEKLIDHFLLRLKLSWDMVGSSHCSSLAAPIDKLNAKVCLLLKVIKHYCMNDRLGEGERKQLIPENLNDPILD